MVGVFGRSATGNWNNCHKTPTSTLRHARTVVPSVPYRKTGEVNSGPPVGCPRLPQLHFSCSHQVTLQGGLHPAHSTPQKVSFNPSNYPTHSCGIWTRKRITGTHEHLSASPLHPQTDTCTVSLPSLCGMDFPCIQSQASLCP